MKDKSETNIRDNVKIEIYEADDIDGRRLPRVEADPVDVEEAHNVITDDYKRHLADLLNPEASTTPYEASHLAVGNDDTGESLSDDSLLNEVYRTTVDDITGPQTTNFNCITLLGGNEANGYDLVEWGLVDDSQNNFVNRVVVNNDKLKPKTTDWAVAVRIEIEFLDISEV